MEQKRILEVYCSESKEKNSDNKIAISSKNKDAG